jgi:hypothetical protein
MQTHYRLYKRIVKPLTHAAFVCTSLNETEVRQSYKHCINSGLDSDLGKLLVCDFYPFPFVLSITTQHALQVSAKIQN